MNYYEIDPKKCANESHAGYMYTVVWTGNGMYVTEKPVTIGVTVSAIIADEDLSPYMKKLLSIPNTQNPIRAMDFVDLQKHGEKCPSCSV